MQNRGSLWIVAFACLAVGCAALTIEPVDYSWGIESVLPVAPDGAVTAAPRTLAFNAAPLFRLELGEMPRSGKPVIRVIRNRAGHYFITAPSFKHVYVFTAGTGRLKLLRNILVDPDGMKKPAFNQRDPFIQLVNGDRTWMLTEKGISGGN